VTARASDSMFYALSLYALQIVFTITITMIDVPILYWEIKVCKFDQFACYVIVLFG